MLDLKYVDENSPWSFQLVESNRLITRFLKQKLIIKTSNTPHQPSSRGHWCTLLGELGIVHLLLSKPIAKAKLRRWNWNQDCINLDTRRTTKAGKTQENWRESRERGSDVEGLKCGMHYRCHESWLWSNTELEFGVFLKWEEKQITHKKTWSKTKNQNSDLTHFITTDPGLLSRPH